MKTKSKTSSLQRGREAAAAELNLPVSDWRVVRLATLTSAHEAMQALLATAPERVDVGRLLDVDRAVAELRKEIGATKPIELKVTFVSGCVGTFVCQHCRQENRIANYEPPPIPEPAPAAPAAAVAEPSNPANVIPLDPAQRAAELRTIARTTAGVCPPIAAPRPNYNFPDNESPAALSRRISDAYR